MENTKLRLSALIIYVISIFLLMITIPSETTIYNIEPLYTYMHRIDVNIFWYVLVNTIHGWEVFLSPLGGALYILSLFIWIYFMITSLFIKRENYLLELFIALFTFLQMIFSIITIPHRRSINNVPVNFSVFIGTWRMFQSSAIPFGIASLTLVIVTFISLFKKRRSITQIVLDEHMKKTSPKMYILFWLIFGLVQIGYNLTFLILFSIEYWFYLHLAIGLSSILPFFLLEALIFNSITKSNNKIRKKVLDEVINTKTFDVAELSNRLSLNEKAIIRIAISDIIKEYLFSTQKYNIEEIAEDINVDKAVIREEGAKAIIKAYVTATNTYNAKDISTNTRIPLSTIADIYGYKLITSYIASSGVRDHRNIRTMTALPHTTVEEYMNREDIIEQSSSTSSYRNQREVHKGSREEKIAQINRLKGLLKIHGEIKITKAAEILKMPVNLFMDMIYELVGSNAVKITIVDDKIVPSKDYSVDDALESLENSFANWLEKEQEGIGKKFG